MNLLFLFCIFLAYGQEGNHPKYNLNFEQFEQTDISTLPKGWSSLGHFYVHTENTIVNTGSHAVLVENTDRISSFGGVGFIIPNEFQGKTIKLEGYIKTENIHEGFAGLLLKIDKNQQTLAFDNMENQNLQGTNDWKKYSITLPFYDDADYINVAGILVGRGKAWFDDFTIYIDGIDIQNKEIIMKIPSKPELDKEFDEGSKFNMKTFTQQDVENLYQLGKKWGHIKYHNPYVAKGEYNWDYELFRILPEISNPDFKFRLKQWETFFKPKNNSTLKEHYYIGFPDHIGSPKFKNEKSYPKMHWEDDGFRLLALFRYWNIVNYFFPYKNLIDKNWDDVLIEYIPKILTATDEISYKLTMLQLIGEINDTHANIWQEDAVLKTFFGNRIVPINIEFVENKALITKLNESYKPSNSLSVGDEIVSINKKSVTQYIEETKPYYPASNGSVQLRDMAKKLLRTNAEELEITISNEKSTFTKTFETIDYINDIHFQDQIPSHKVLQKGEIGYIYPGNLKNDEIHNIMGKFMDKKGIIIDLRCFPSELTVFSLGNYFMPEPTEFVKFSTTTLENPGLFSFGKPLVVGTDNPDYYKGRIAILVNETTQSSAEYHAMAFRVAPKAKVLGSQTAGADGNISTMVLPGNIHTSISGIGVYYPDGTGTQRIGIIADIEVKPTVTGFRNGKDEVLERAIEYIQTGK